MIFIFLLLFFFFFSPSSIVHRPWSSSLQAYMTIPQKEAKSDDLTAHADTAFKGICQSKRQDFTTHPVTHTKIPIDVYTFKVEEGLKGNVKKGEFVEVRQIAVKTQREALDLQVGFVSRTNFDIGKKYLLFFGKPSAFGTDTIISNNQ